LQRWIPVHLKRGIFDQLNEIHVHYIQTAAFITSRVEGAEKHEPGKKEHPGFHGICLFSNDKVNTDEVKIPWVH
jgi:hypothetical protein